MMDELESELYSEFTKRIEIHRSDGHKLQDILNVCSKFANHYKAHTSIENYDRCDELKYMMRNMDKYYEHVYRKT